MSSLVKRFRSRGPGLTLQLLLFFILPLTALLLIVAVGSQVLHQQAMRAIVGERDGRSGQLAAQALTEQLQYRASTIRFLAQQTAAESSFPDTLSSSSFPFSEFDGGLALFDSTGKLLTAQGAIAELEPAAILSFLKSAGPDPVFSPPVTASTSGKTIILVAASIPGGPIVAGAFFPDILIQGTFHDVFDPATGMAVFIVGPDRQLVYQSGICRSSVPCTQHPGVAEALQGKSGITYVSTGGSEHVVAYSPVEPAGWGLVIEEPWAEVENPSLRATQYAPLALIPALILALAALWFGVRQIEQPLQSLESKASDLTWGRFNTIEQSVGGIAEIRRLQTELIHLAQKVKTAQKSLHSYIGAITSGQEEERRRLARELHDSTLQALIALNQRVQLAKLSPSDKPTEEMLANIQTLLEQTMTDLRLFTRALRPIYLEDLGLVAALETLTQEVGQSAGTPVEFRKSGPEHRLAPEVELALYRLAQEALSNATRHSQATHIILSIAFSPEKVTLVVSDDGIGYAVPDNPAEFVSEGHFGLLGMHERVELIGGLLEIHSEPGKGTRVTVSVAF
jgi:two-component system sensor histidine kinase UhpB